MARDLTASLLAQLTAGALRPVLLYEGEFASGAVRAWSGYGDLLYPKFRYAFMGGALPANAVLTRGSAGLYVDSAADLRSAASDVARFTHTSAGALRGVYAEPQKTNKCENYNANPTDLTNVAKTGSAAATLTVVDDSAALAAAGLDAICSSGKVYKVDNSAGTGSAFINITGAAGSAVAHAASAWLRGSGTVRVELQGTGGATVRTLTSAYQRFSQNQTPAFPSLGMTITVIAGAVAYFILNQLEEGTAASSEIVVAGASATRAADALVLGGLADGAYSFEVTRESGVTTYSGQSVVDSEWAVPTDLSPVQSVVVSGATLATYQGVGHLAGISAITETGDIKATGITVTLSGVPAPLISTVYGEARQGKPGRVMLAAMGDDGYLVPSPFLAFSGKLDVPQDNDDGETATIAISYESRLVDLERARERRYTPEDQAIDHPGDKGFDFVAALQDVQVVWGRT